MLIAFDKFTPLNHEHKRFFMTEIVAFLWYTLPYFKITCAFVLVRPKLSIPLSPGDVRLLLVTHRFSVIHD